MGKGEGGEREREKERKREKEGNSSSSTFGESFWNKEKLFLAINIPGGALVN